MQLLAWATLLPLALAAAPVIQPRGLELIPYSYIIKLKDDASEDMLQSVIKELLTPAKHVYRIGKFKGFAAKLSPLVLEIVRKLPDVEYIEQDAVITASAYTTQTSPPWGLARISHRDPTANTYVYDESAGEGTCSYVLDTGIYVEHNEFGGRASFAANFADLINTDQNGHGTHVAGTLGGQTYGVAKKTKLLAVKIFDGQARGTIATLLAGIDFIAADALVRKLAGQCPKGVVANASLEIVNLFLTNLAVAAAVATGVFFAVSAGNNNADVQGYSPASEPTACTVGAIDWNDAKASFSNFGAGVDVFALGVDVLSSWIGGVGATKYESGTSQACPHVAGLGAYLLALQGPRTPAQLCQYIRDTATLGDITGLPSGTFNGIAFNGNPNP